MYSLYSDSKYRTLERIIKISGRNCSSHRVKVVAGDARVLKRGEGGGLYLATTGIGIRNGHVLSIKNIKDGDAIIGQIDSSIQHFLMETDIGGECILEEIEDDPLSKIC